MTASVRVGTRGSGLALRQTETVIAALRELGPGVDFTIETIRSAGDQSQDAPLASLGIGVFTAAIDAKTNDHRLWLRFGDSSVLLLRPIQWERIVAARHQGKILTVDQLRELAETLKKLPVQQAASSQPPQPTEPQQSSPTYPTFAQRAQAALDAEIPLASIALDAYIANWDGDVEADGLIIQLYPLGADGRVKRVGGTVEVELTALRGVHFAGASHSRGIRATRMARWTREINPDQVGPWGVMIKLPFQALHPEFDTDLSTHGLVHLRFAVPGHGVFEQSQDGVRIRPFSPLRDQLQRSQGSRFLPHERTGRGKRSTGRGG